MIVIIGTSMMANVVFAWVFFLLMIFFGFLSSAYHRDYRWRIYGWRESRRFAVWFFVLSLECLYVCGHFVLRVWGNV